MIALLKSLNRFVKAGIAIFLLLLACGKDSDSDNDYEDPRFHGSMEAKVNGELKVWPSTIALARCNCDPFGCACACNDGLQCGYVGSLPDVTETIGIRWDVSEDYGCADLDAWYAISDVDNISGGDAIIHYGSRDICEDEDPFTPNTYICHQVSFTITPVGDDIYRGTFSFVASRNCGEEEVVVTDGKFEVKIAGTLCDSN